MSVCGLIALRAINARANDRSPTQPVPLMQPDSVENTPKKDYVLTFEPDRFNDPGMYDAYPTCSTFINHYQHRKPQTISDYFGVLTEAQLVAMDKCIQGFYQGDDRSVQELLLLYTLLYQMQTGSRQIPVDAQLNWLVPILNSASYEKRRREGLIEMYSVALATVRFQVTYADGREEVITF